ncbi:hypothetical protein [Nocardia iowensis]|uniref:Uncharacterized protein n=1 Tax=Nocardia iowensis TaxID=204891 RepID=A0ABX8RZA2_NOCIO|nr:hypothetical protein [Nocardia iowensis]QXN95019.1 hypothetical protein KV110_19415 [Nocardia iowensis]
MTDDLDRAAEVHVRTGAGTPVPELTDALLTELLDDPPDPQCPAILINRGDHAYIRARLLPDGVYELEHRADGADEQFQMYTPDARLVRDVMWAWVDENPWWRDGVAWYRVDPAVAEVQSALREFEDLLGDMSVLDGIQETMDDAMARADELLATDIAESAPETDESP